MMVVGPFRMSRILDVALPVSSLEGSGAKSTVQDVSRLLFKQLFMHTKALGSCSAGAFLAYVRMRERS